MRTKTIKSKSIALLSALFAIIFAMVLTIASSGSSAFAAENSAVLFDGTNSSATVPAANTTVEGITVNIVGMSDMQSISGGYNLDGMTYNKAIKTGGKSSSSRYFSFTVPATLAKFTVKVVAAPNGSEAANFSLSAEGAVLETDDVVFFTTGTSSTTYTSGTSAVQTVTESTTFYLNFSASARIAYVEVTPVIEDNSSGLSTYSGTLDKTNNSKKGFITDENRDIVTIIQLASGVLLVVLVAVGVISIVRKNHRKSDFDWDDFDDYDE